MCKTKVSIRFDWQQLDVIDKYANLTGLTRSEVIRQFCRNGSQNMANMRLQEEFIADQQKRWLNLPKIKIVGELQSLIFERDGQACRKCGRTDNLNIYSIDKNPLNKDPKYKITLCDSCKEWAEKYSPKRRVMEDFVEWFCLL